MYNPVFDEELEIEETLKNYFNGEYKRKIKLFKKKIKEGIPGGYYWSITSLNLNNTKISKTNNIHTPTEDNALKLIEIQEERLKLYKYYLQLQNTITELLIKLEVTDQDRIILFSHLRISEDSFTKAVKFTGYSYTKARLRIDKLKKAINQELKEVLRGEKILIYD